MSSRIQHWARATVTKAEEMSDEIIVQFENEPSAYDRKLTRLSPEVAFPNTFTDDFDWRYQITADDIVDSLDSEAIWYKSTILNEKFESFLGEQKECKQVYVAYRFYNDDEGHKVDDDGRRYVGWSNKYDEWITVTSPQIQKLGTMCKHYK